MPGFLASMPQKKPFLLSDIGSNTPHLIDNDSNTPYFNLSLYKYYKRFLKLSTCKYIILVNILNT